MALYPDYPVLTERLRLRPFTRGDVDAVFAYRQRDDVARYLFDLPMSRETCAEAVQNRISQLSFALEGDRIIVTPTLVKKAPGPKTWIVGTLTPSDAVTQMLVSALGEPDPTLQHQRRQ